MNLKTTTMILMTFLVSNVFAAPWDIFRGPIQVVNELDVFVTSLGVIFALAVLIFSLLALKKKFSQKLLFVGIAFGLFFIKSSLMLIDLFFSPGYFMNFSMIGFFDLLVIVALFIALFKK